MLRKDLKRVLRANMLKRGVASAGQLLCTIGCHEDPTTAILIADIPTAGQHHIQIQAADSTPHAGGTRPAAGQDSHTLSSPARSVPCGCREWANEGCL